MPLIVPLTKALIIHIIMARNKGEQLKKKLDIVPLKFQLNVLYFVYKFKYFFGSFNSYLSSVPV